jgi:predicted regulator of Ras-like GTPase activity (Roadblock/LC7/MglB family)
MATLAELMDTLVKVDGVKAAAVIGKDGFVIERSSQSGNVDMDTVGAIVTGGLQSSMSIGEELKIGRILQNMIEYENGIILSKIISDGQALITIVADSRAMLGNIRYQVNKFTSEIQQNL